MADANETLANWQAKTAAVTEGPWEHGDRQHIAGVLPGQFGDGKCAYCGRFGEPTWVGRRSINGTRMLAHVHQSEELWWDHGIYAFREDGSVLVVNDTDEYGYIADSDAKFIAASRTAMPRLLSAVEKVLALHTKGLVLIIASDGSLTDRETCLHCTGIDEGDAAPPNEVYFWPCQTVRAITDALDGEQA